VLPPTFPTATKVRSGLTCGFVSWTCARRSDFVRFTRWCARDGGAIARPGREVSLWSRKGGAGSCDHGLVTIFTCRSCGAVVTGDLAVMAMPADAPNGEEAVPRMPLGRFAVNPNSYGPPYVPTSSDSRVRVSGGPQGTIVVNPGDVLGLVLHPDRRRRNGCCRLDGLDGPNLVCESCGSEIATEQSDCWVSWHDVRLEPAAVVAAGSAG
jgi:hypothetical protein